MNIYDHASHMPLVGYDDLGHGSVMGNGGVTHSPNINALMDNGIILHDYYTFKVCSPSRASLLTGRYPWGAGFYDMSDDNNHCTHQFTASDNSVSTR